MITRERADRLDQWLSQSRVNAAGKCLYQYALVHVDKLVRRWAPAPLRRGTLVHRGFEAALLWDWAARHLGGFGTYQGTGPRNPDAFLAEMLAIGAEAIRQQQAAWMADPKVKPFVDPDMLETAEKLVDDSIRMFRRSFAALGVHTGVWRTVGSPTGGPFIEYKMEVPFPGWAGFHGTLDWVAKDHRGHVWLWDFKTRKVLTPAEHDRLQLQAPCYQYLLEQTLGVHLVGTVTYQIRAALRKVPSMNKTKTKQPDGTSSIGMTRAPKTTDWPTYRQALLDNGLDPELYLDVKAQLPESFDRIEQYYRGPRETAAVWKTVQDVVAHLEVAHSENRFPRNINPFTCRGCSHRTLCEADLHDEDTDALIRTEYMREGDTPLPDEVVFGEDEYDSYA